MRKVMLEKSMALYEKAEDLIPNVTQCFSKGPTQFSFGVCPVYLRSGKGARVTDVDDNEYIDYGMGLHSVILGYAHPKVTRVIEDAVQDGISLTLMHPLEVEVALLFRERIPCAEMIRYTKTGSEGLSAAVKIARVVTNKDNIASNGYHGWHDWFIAGTEKNAGIPQSTKDAFHRFDYNDIDSLERVFHENRGKIGSVVMEPCGVVPPKDDFLNKCKQVARDNGALLIFDEVITGVRWHAGGAQALFNVTPDIAVFGKSIANGMPLAAVVGKKEYMEVLNEEKVFVSSTFGGEIGSLAAAKAVHEILEEENVVESIWKRGRQLMDGLNGIIRDKDLDEILQVKGFPCRPVASFMEYKDNSPWVMKSYIQQECVKRGILFTGYFAVSLAHTSDIIDESLGIFEEVLTEMAVQLQKGCIKDSLEGEVVSPVFRQL